MVKCLFNFVVTAELFFKMVVPFSLPPIKYEIFSSFTSSPTLGIVRFKNIFVTPVDVRWNLNCGLSLPLPEY